MDESLSRAARAGDVRELYRLIQGDGNLLRSFDDVEFTDTPLHIAADEGCIDFAMEIMNLKPSFAWKLNQKGLSPIHLAVKKGHKKLVLRLLEINKDVVRVKGKNGTTPFHYLCKLEGNCEDLLTRFLETCPECIREVTTKNQTALHIAIKCEKLDVLQVLTRKLRNTDYCQEVANRKDRDGNTALHLAAASNNQGPKMLKLLLRCKADKQLTNEDGSTALEVAKQFNNRESIKILSGCFIPGVSNFKNVMKKQIVNYVAKASTAIFHDMDRISSEDRNALLVILGLLLTATFQASLSPPGSVWQGDNSSNSNSTGVAEKMPGKSVMDEVDFLLFYIPTYAVFIATFFLTLALLKPFPRGFRTALEVLLAFLAICFDESISFLAPSVLTSTILSTFSVVVFVLMMFMSINLRVSKISVLILGGWLFPTYLYQSPVGSLVTACLFFILSYDDFWKGTILVLGYCFGILVLGYVLGNGVSAHPIRLLGCWLFLSLCRFSIQLCNQHCPLFNLLCVNV